MPDDEAVAAAGRIEKYRLQTFERAGPDDLPTHLAGSYGIKVESARALDVGVIRIDRPGSPPWVARVFPV